MKKNKIVLFIAVCLMICSNLIPVYGSDTSVMQSSDEINNVIEKIENSENSDEIIPSEPGDTDVEIDVPAEPEIMPLTPPAAVKATLINKKNVKLTWNKVMGATGYEVYRCLYKNGKYKYHKTVKGTSYIDKKTYAGECFYYKVRAVNDKNDALKSKLSIPAFYCMKPAAPVISAKNNNGQITVSWKKVYGAQKYYISVYN